MTRTEMILFFLATMLFLSMGPEDFGFKGKNDGKFLSSVSSGIVV
jgi:hypothetical protein